MKLPPGQYPVEGFPRFGTHLDRPAPPVPLSPGIEITGAVVRSIVLPITGLATLSRRKLTADFHCVAGWSATSLHWEGVEFATLYEDLIVPSLRPGPPVTHVVFVGLDGFRSVVTIEDALAKDVLIADRLEGRPLDSDHGAPARLVSPRQYGYVSTKHLCRVELHTSRPADDFGAVSPIARLGFRFPVLRRHPRARVWEEERHPNLPGWSLRPLYRLLAAPIAFLSARGGQRRL